MTTRSKLVLVADDYDQSALLIAEILRASAPLETMVAKDGQDALAQALARPPDAAILDLDMPYLGGIEVARALRAALQERRPLLIAMSGAGLDAAMLSGMFDHVLRKPVAIAVLLKLLEDI